MSRFRRLTTQQRSTLKALRTLGSMTVTPRDARQLRALKRRGLVRYKRDGAGVRIAVLRENAAVRNRHARDQRWLSRIWEALHAPELRT